MDNPSTPIPLTPPQTAASKKFLWLGGLTVLTLGIAIGIFGAKFLNQKQSQPPLVLAPIPTPTPAPNLYREPDGSAATADWKTYTNTKYSYLIQHPSNLKTQVLAAGATNQDASINSDHIFIFDPSSQEPYLERYIEIQPLGQAPVYGTEWQREDIKINGINVAKFINPNPDTFVIYRVAIPNTPGELEIMVTKNPKRNTMADQILSTFKFLD